MPAFDNEKYLSIQKEEIQKRIGLFGGKLYLEFGGKLFDDFHAARVLPGFAPDSKLQLLLQFKDQAEIIFVINSKDIEDNKVRNDSGVTYQSEVERLIDAYRETGFEIGGVVLSMYDNSPSVNAFINKLKRNDIKVYKHYQIEGYPRNIENIFSEKGFSKNEYVETKHPLVVVTAPGPGSGKMAVCLSQLFHDLKCGVKSGYAKYETFPTWNLPLKHPVNLAYEAATADLNDINMIDPYHLEAYGLTAVNYNRDIEVFPILRRIFEKLYAKSPYNSPTDMGVNMLGFAISDEEEVIKASKDEIIRRYYQAAKNNFLGKFPDEAVTKIENIMNQLGLTIGDRKCVKKCMDKNALALVPTMGIELKDGTLISGKRGGCLGAPAAMILNSLKHLAHIDDAIPLLSPSVIRPIESLKSSVLNKHNPKIRAEEILIALAIQANSNPLAELALNQLESLRGTEAHSSCILSQTDLRTLTDLGIHVTEEPKGYAHKLYLK